MKIALIISTIIMILGHEYFITTFYKHTYMKGFTTKPKDYSEAY
jgi:hypothetical protein